MTRTLTRLLFVSLCVVISILLALKAVGVIIGAAVFAIALVAFGILSGGFGKRALRKDEPGDSRSPGCPGPSIKYFPQEGKWIVKNF